MIWFWKELAPASGCAAGAGNARLSPAPHRTAGASGPSRALGGAQEAQEAGSGRTDASALPPRELPGFAESRSPVTCPPRLRGAGAPAPLQCVRACTCPPQLGAQPRPRSRTGCASPYRADFPGARRPRRISMAMGKHDAGAEVAGPRRPERLRSSPPAGALRPAGGAGRLSLGPSGMSGFRDQRRSKGGCWNGRCLLCLT